MRAFLDLQPGVTRDEAAPWIPQADQERELEEAHGELAELRARLVRNDAEPGVGSANPENVAWLFGMGKSGNTWLSSMMEDLTPEQAKTVERITAPLLEEPYPARYNAKNIRRSRRYS